MTAATITTSKRKIASNILFLGSSQVVTWLMTTIYTILVPRYLGPGGIGALAIGWTISGLVVLVAAFGSGTFLVKEIAQEPENAPWLVGTTIIVNVALGVTGWAGVLLFVNIAGIAPELGLALIILAINDFITLATTAISTSLQGMEKMKYTFVTAVVSKGLYTILGVSVAYFQLGIAFVAFSGLVAGLPGILLNVIWFTRHYRIDFSIQKRYLKKVIMGGLPFLIMSLTLQLYISLDGLMLSIMTDQTIVGYYSVPNRLFGTLLFVPVIVGNAILPALSRMAKQNIDEHKLLTRYTLNVFICASFPMAAGATVIASSLISLLYGDKFLPSIPVLMIIAWTTIPTYLNVGIVQSLVAEGRQNAWTKINILAFGINFFINLFTITFFQHFWQNGALGTATALLITEVIISTLGLRILSRGILTRDFWISALKSFLATGIMVAVILPLHNTFFLITAFVGVIVYGLAVLWLGIIPPAILSSIMARVMRTR